jgi:hypothetical protein
MPVPPGQNCKPDLRGPVFAADLAGHFTYLQVDGPSHSTIELDA